MKQNEHFKQVISHAKEYGFVFHSSEIYDGLSAVYDYGQNGTQLKNNIRNYWWKAMTQVHNNIVGIDSGIFMHPKIWKASGHVDAFNDPLIDNKDSKKRYRADVLVEDYLSKLENKIEKEVSKGQKQFKKNFDKNFFLKTNPNILRIREKITEISKRLITCMNEENWVLFKALIEELELADPETGSKNWSEIRQFNLMFETKIGATIESSQNLYLRPETAQGIFVNFMNVQKTSRMKIPFGIAQTGKAFRNEIIARQFIFRMREFEQMEMQFFIKPGDQKKWYEYWKESRLNWHLSLGLDKDNYRFHNHEKLAHYADSACDIEFKFPFGFKELEGIHSRTDFDLGSHEKFSGKKLQYFDNKENKSYLPYVIETSIGLDRMFLAVFSIALQNEKLPDGSNRLVLKLPRILSPIKVAILPLVKKEELREIAKNLINELKFDFELTYDEKDAIGRRYRRQDAIGTPFCVTVDFTTKEEQLVTVRDRDSMQQESIHISKLKTFLSKKLDIKSYLKNC